MKTLIQTRHQEIDDTLRRYILNRVKSALSILVNNVSNVLVKLNSNACPEGGKLKVCEIVVTVQGHELVVASGQRTHWLAAIDQAVEAAARAVRRTIGKKKKSA